MAAVLAGALARVPAGVVVEEHWLGRRRRSPRCSFAPEAAYRCSSSRPSWASGQPGLASDEKGECRRSTLNGPRQKRAEHRGDTGQDCSAIPARQQHFPDHSCAVCHTARLGKGRQGCLAILAEPVVRSPAPGPVEEHRLVVVDTVLGREACLQPFQRLPPAAVLGLAGTLCD